MATQKFGEMRGGDAYPAGSSECMADASKWRDTVKESKMANTTFQMLVSFLIKVTIWAMSEDHRRKALSELLNLMLEQLDVHLGLSHDKAEYWTGWTGTASKLHKKVYQGAVMQDSLQIADKVTAAKLDLMEWPAIAGIALGFTGHAMPCAKESDDPPPQNHVFSDVSKAHLIRVKGLVLALQLRIKYGFTSLEIERLDQVCGTETNTGPTKL